MPWIQVEGDIKRAYRTLIVFSSEQATRMGQEDAENVKGVAQIAHPNYVWNLVRVMGFDSYVIEGTYPRPTILIK
jgi:hypothetical protein